MAYAPEGRYLPRIILQLLPSQVKYYLFSHSESIQYNAVT